MGRTTGEKRPVVIRTCEYCMKSFKVKVGRGRPRKFCCPNHRKRMFERREREREAAEFERWKEAMDAKINEMDMKIALQADEIHRRSLQLVESKRHMLEARELRRRQEREFRLAAEQMDRLFASGTLKADHDSPTWQQDRHLTQWQEVISRWAKPEEPDPYDELMELDEQFEDGKNRWRLLRTRAVRELPPNPTDEDRRIARERISELERKENLWTSEFFKAHPRFKAWRDMLEFLVSFKDEHGYLPDDRIPEYARLHALVSGEEPERETEQETDPWGL